MKQLLLILFISLTGWTSISALGQGNDDVMKQLLANSAPGKQHALLSDLAGSWTFQDQKLAFVKGTVVRKEMYEGRFFMVEITGGKLQIPVADGKMKEANYQSMQIEGYDNPRAKFVTISINDHIGSDIQMQFGTYDPNKKTFSYDWDEELIPGEKTKNRRLLRVVDKDHYVEEFFELHNGEPVKVRELDYTRIKE